MPIVDFTKSKIAVENFVPIFWQIWFLSPQSAAPFIFVQFISFPVNLIFPSAPAFLSAVPLFVFSLQAK